MPIEAGGYRPTEAQARIDNQAGVETPPTDEVVVTEVAMSEQITPVLAEETTIDTPLTPELQAQINEQISVKPDRLKGAQLLAAVIAKRKVVERSFNRQQDKNKEIKQIKDKDEQLQERLDAGWQGEKLPDGKPDVRRAYAYLTHLESIINQVEGKELEQKWWQLAADSLLIKPEDIPESYWQHQRQELRNNAMGRVEVDDNYKAEITKALQNEQRASLQPWINYLSSETSPYPLWFKLYVWEGMSKVGDFNEKTKSYDKRDKSSVKPFTDLNPEIIGAIYDIAIRDSANATTEQDRLSQLLEQGRFNEAYSEIMSENRYVIPVPENPDDVVGEWFEFKPGQEEEIKTLATGTGWCIGNSTATVDNYLQNGDHNYRGPRGAELGDNNSARFFLFRLQDNNSRFSDQACASVRLNPDGKVAELSGLLKDQGINDSLVFLVEDKAKSLPGGEEFLPKLADKKTLIAIDKKFQAGQPLSKEDLEFIYEIYRPINKLNTYGQDPRIDEIKRAYPIEKVLEAGVKADDLMKRMMRDEIVQNLDALVAHGAQIDVNELIKQLHAPDIAENLDALIKHGAKIDVNELLEKQLNVYHTIENLDSFIRHGAQVDINELIERMTNYTSREIDILIQLGADIDHLTSYLYPKQIAENLDALIKHGAQINVDELIGSLLPGEIAERLDTLVKHGAQINVDELIGELAPTQIDFYFDNLVKNGINTSLLLQKLAEQPQRIRQNYNKLLAAGATPEMLAPYVK